MPISARLAEAAENCGARQVVVGKLITKYRERAVATGMTPNGNLIEIYVSPDTGSWTVLIVLPNGLACMAAAGVTFEVLAVGPQGEPL